MATTVFFDIEPDDWIDVSPMRRGYLSNITDADAIYVEAETKPLSSQTLGHRLHPHEILTFILTGPGRVFMRSVREQGRVAVTPGITFYECCDTLIPANFVFQDGNNYVFQDGDNYELN